MKALTYTITQHPDFSSWEYWMCKNDVFDVDLYAESMSIDVNDITESSIREIEAALSVLGRGFWIKVGHSNE